MRMCSYLLITLALLLSGRAVLAQAPVHYIVGVDRSASRSAQQMKDMQVFARALAARLNYGDAISMVQIFQARSDQVIEFRDTIPLLRVPGQPVRREVLTLNALRDAYGRQARRLTDTVGMRVVTTTDILGFLRRASSYARSGDGRRVVVVVLSDMLQSVPGLDFERAGEVPGTSWIETQRRDGLLPNLTGVCVAAVGVEEGTARSVRVRDFWMRYAKESGAILKAGNYRLFMTPQDIDC